MDRKQEVWKKISDIKNKRVPNPEEWLCFSDLVKRDYCEYQLYLKYKSNIIPKISEALINGNIKHKQQEKVWKSHEKKIDRLYERIKDGTVPPVTSGEGEFPLVSERLKMYGFPDLIHISSALVEIWERKKDPNGWQIKDDYGCVQQIAAEAMAFKEMFEYAKPIYAKPIVIKIVDRDDGRIHYNSILSERHERIVTESLERIRSFLNGGAAAVACGNEKKCRWCGYKEGCENAKS